MQRYPSRNNYTKKDRDRGLDNVMSACISLSDPGVCSQFENAQSNRSHLDMT